jgi:hypothetical protein
MLFIRLFAPKYYRDNLAVFTEEEMLLSRNGEICVGLLKVTYQGYKKRRILNMQTYE